MSDNAELHSKIQAFLIGQFSKRDSSLCVAVDLDFSPGNNFRDEQLRKWSREDDPDLFDTEKFVHVEGLVKQIIEIAINEVDAKPAGQYRFVIRTREHLGGRSTHSFSLKPAYTGSEDTALAPSNANAAAAGRQDMVLQTIANHANQHARINAQMFDGALRALSNSNMKLHEQIIELQADNVVLRRENDTLKLGKEDREFQYAMEAEKQARIGAGVQKALQIGSVIAAKIAGSGEGSGSSSALSMLITDLKKSLKKSQIEALMGVLDMPQKIMFFEIMNMAEPPANESANGTSPRP